jgi:hypothetical protein
MRTLDQPVSRRGLLGGAAAATTQLVHWPTSSPSTSPYTDRPWTTPHTPDARREFELYDLATDRGETRDVAALHPAARARMEHDMNASHVDPT